MIDNLVYAVGGSNRDDGTRSNLNSMERYNPEKDEWEDMPPMHRCRGAASVTALNGCLYAVGGYDSGTYMYMCSYRCRYIISYRTFHWAGEALWGNGNRFLGHLGATPPVYFWGETIAKFCEIDTSLTTKALAIFQLLKISGLWGGGFQCLPPPPKP